MKFSTFCASLIVLIASLSLAACVARQETAIIQAPGVGTQAARPAGPPVITKTVLAGKTIDIVGMTSVNPDCTPATLATIRITQQPTHGTAVVTQNEAYPAFPAANPKSTCNKTKTPGVVARYTPEPGFTGSDLMALEIFTSSGMDSNEIKVLLTVK